MQILKDEIRDKILTAAEDMFYQKGFKETTTRGIASEAGISVSNLYLYYENKEAIFYAITDSFYKYFMYGLEQFLNHKDQDSEMGVKITGLIQKIIAADQKKFTIIAARSQGTKYETFKLHIVEVLYNHMKSQINQERVKDEFIIYLLAKNFIEGIIEIAQNYQSEEWLENMISTLVEYHMSGMSSLM